jgi:hypothetical protein
VTVVAIELPFVSLAQIAMLRALARCVDREAEKHGVEHAWIEQGQLVMDEATRSLGGLAWRNADRVLGGLDRRGLIERDTTYDDLIRPSALGRDVLTAHKDQP